MLAWTGVSLRLSVSLRESRPGCVLMLCSRMRRNVVAAAIS